MLTRQSKKTTMPSMPKRKPGSEQPKRKPPNRSGEPLNVWIDNALMAALNAYIEATVPRTSKTAVVELALHELLKAKGHWPPPSPAAD